MSPSLLSWSLLLTYTYIYERDWWDSIHCVLYLGQPAKYSLSLVFHIYFRKHKVLTELACLMFNSSNIQIYDITLFSEVLWMPHNQIFERLHCRHVSCVTSFRCWQIYLEAWRFQNRVKVVEALLTIANLDQNQSWHLRTFN